MTISNTGIPTVISNSIVISRRICREGKMLGGYFTKLDVIRKLTPCGVAVAVMLWMRRMIQRAQAGAATPKPI